MRLTAALFFEARTCSPFAAEVPESGLFAPILMPRAQHIVSYHVVTGGACWAGLLGGPATRIETGDAVLFPGGQHYVMSSRPGMRAPGGLEATLASLRELAARRPPVTRLGSGAKEDCQLVCGYLGCDAHPFNPVLAALPPLLRVRPAADPASDRLSPLVAFALAESRDPRSGGQCVLLRLSELMFVEVVRRYLAELPAEQPGWLAGLRDPVVGRALALLHDQPGRAWTLDKLAAEVGASRSSLAERFAHFVGRPPMHYLAHWRMQIAARLLADGAAKVGAIAAEIGYESEPAFSRAFKRIVGVSPASWRKSAS